MIAEQTYTNTADATNATKNADITTIIQSHVLILNELQFDSDPLTPKKKKLIQTQHEN